MFRVALSLVVVNSVALFVASSPSQQSNVSDSSGFLNIEVGAACPKVGSGNEYYCYTVTESCDTTFWPGPDRNRHLRSCAGTLKPACKVLGPKIIKGVGEDDIKTNPCPNPQVRQIKDCDQEPDPRGPAGTVKCIYNNFRNEDCTVGGNSKELLNNPC